jgi:predicted ATPase
VFDHIKIEGFRSFKKVELDLPPLSVLIGPNNGGKSNFLDLMSLMAEAGQGGLAKGIDSRGGFSGIAFGFGQCDKILMELRFQANSLHHISAFEAPPPTSLEKEPDVRFKVALKDSFAIATVVWVEEVTEEPTPQRPRPVSIMKRDKDGCVFRSARAEKGAAIEDRKALESDFELAIFQVKDLYKYPIPYNVLKQFQEWTLYRDINVGSEASVRQPGLVRPTVRLAADGANLSSVLYSIQQKHPDTWNEIIEVLHTAYPDFRAITFPPEGGDGKVVLRWREQPFEKQGVSANFLSDGTLKFLCLIAILKSPDPPPLICIDEPELGLHPDWIEIVAELMQSAAARTQLIVATHSPQIVAKLDPEQVIVTEKEKGETHLRRLERRELEKWLNEFNLSDLWLAGEFGGRP